MSLTDTGATAIASALLGDGVVDLFDNTNAAIGVGDSTEAFNANQTELHAETSPGNAIRKEMNSGYPNRDPESNGSDNVTRYQSVFGTSEANFVWNEWGIFNNVTASSGTMLLRVVENLGTKTSAAQWVFEVDITVVPSE